MNGDRTSAWFRPLGILALSWTAAFSLACRLSDSKASAQPGGDTIAGRFLGQSRVAFGQSFMEEADTFFHMGVGHFHTRAFTNDVYQQWSHAIRPTTHVHTHGYHVSEIMPWLRFATDMDPHNVEAYLTTAYWLGDAIKRPDLESRILLEAESNNPGDYRILSARGRMFFAEHDDAKAAALLDAGIRMWPSQQDPKDDETRLELSEMLSYRAFLYEVNGNRKQSLEMFRRALSLFPRNQGLARRVLAMEQGQDFTDKDRQVWNSVFANSEVARESHHEHEHEGEVEDHDEDEH